MAEGIELAGVGLLVVFLFLGALVLSVRALGWFFEAFGGPELFPEAESRTPRTPGLRPVDSAQVAAIAAATVAHIRDRTR